MEFKKKTIIGEDNNEPPKDYIGAKKDGKFYEYNYATRSGVESKSISGGSSSDEGGGSDDGGSSDSIVDAITNFKITMKKDKSGFFTTNGEPLNNIHYADMYYSSGHLTSDNFGEPVSLEEYFNISDIDVFKGLCGLLKSMDSFATVSYEGCESTVKIAIDTSDALGDSSDINAHVLLSRIFDWDGGTGTLNPCVILCYNEYGSSSTYYPYLQLYLDPSDPTKFYAKPSE